MVSFAFAPVLLNAPLAGSIKLKVVIVVSSTSATFPVFATVLPTPYFANAFATVNAVGAAGRAVLGSLLYGSAPSCTAVVRIDRVWNVYAIAAWSVANPLAAT